MNLKKIYIKYKDIIPYLFFGVCTTLVNIVCYCISAHVLGLGTMVSTIIAWVLAVLFAYITNRKWVFCSVASSTKAVMQEVVAFFGCRIVTGIVDWGGMFVFVELIGLHDVVIKLLCNVLVIVLNYLASKLIIFRK